MKIIDKMHEEDLDTLLILNPYNITYLAGFKPSSSSVLVIKDEPSTFYFKNGHGRCEFKFKNSC